MSPNHAPLKVGIVSRASPDSHPTTSGPLAPIFAAFAANGVEANAISYAEENDGLARRQLQEVDGALVWVEPIDAGRDRSRLDNLLRDLLAGGLWVSAHPDVILRMGTKDVLYDTRGLSWGSDTRIYRTYNAFLEQFPETLLSCPKPRVLKQYRGAAGVGVWKVELADRESAAQRKVCAQEARRGSAAGELPLDGFIDLFREYFDLGGHLVDQVFVDSLEEGLIRLYLCQDQVVGFAHQDIVELAPQPTQQERPTAARFQSIRQRMETEWLPAMIELLGLDVESLPVLWDADFLYGPRDESGADTFVLCEINMSCVTPVPPFAADQIAMTAIRCIKRHRLRPRH